MGCNLVIIAGKDEKEKLLKSNFKFDNAINYKTSPVLKYSIRNACPNGVNIYFDNLN
jgi:NADPH-dependent curcumin reductase CurA